MVSYFPCLVKKAHLLRTCLPLFKVSDLKPKFSLSLTSFPVRELLGLCSFCVTLTQKRQRKKRWDWLVSKKKGMERLVCLLEPRISTGEWILKLQRILMMVHIIIIKKRGVAVLENMFLLVPFLHPSILFFLAMVIKLSFFFLPI